MVILPHGPRVALLTTAAGNPAASAAAAETDPVDSVASSTTAPPPIALGLPKKLQTGPGLLTAKAAAAVSAPPPAVAGRPYYDEDRDRRDIGSYYAKLGPEMARLHPSQAFMRLGKLLKDTHRNQLGYEPSKYLYPWVDLRPDGKLGCIYTTRRVTSEQGESWSRLALGAPLDAARLSLAVALEESRPRFNCEHVVPREWFDDRQPMRGDLHHLFASSPLGNSERGHSRLAALAGSGERLLEGACGAFSTDLTGFEPREGKGAVARATLYFLLRYPGKVSRYGQRDIETLLRWHREDPVSLYEKHRNQAIFQLQGNRNPLIDFPEWADHVNFGFGVA